MDNFYKDDIVTIDEELDEDGDYTQYYDKQGKIIYVWSWSCEIDFGGNIISVPIIMLKRAQTKYEEIMYIENGEWVKEIKEIK